MISIRVTAEQAADALRAAADEDGNIGYLCFTARGEVVPGRQEIEDALDDLTSRHSRIQMIAFEPGPFGHNLAILCAGIIYRYDVPMPDVRHVEKFLEEHGAMLLDVLEDASEDVTYTDERRAESRTVRQALSLLLFPKEGCK